jgi:hypothetical protein
MVGRNKRVPAASRVLSGFIVLSSGFDGHKDVRPQEICCLTALSTNPPAFLFPTQRPNQNEGSHLSDSQTTNPFFPALTRAARRRGPRRSPPIRSRPGCNVTAGGHTWPNHWSHPKMPPISVSASLSLDYYFRIFI